MQDVADRGEGRQPEAERYRRAFAHLSHGVAICGPDGRLLEVNQRLTELLGRSEAELLALGSLDAIAHRPGSPAKGGAAAALRSPGSGPHVDERSLLTGDGTEMWLRITSTGVYEDGSLTCIVAHVDDVTDRRVAERRLRSQQQQLERQARHDALTGLANRTSLHHELERRLSRTRREQQSLPVLYLDIDRFKLVNDTLGHASGDELLRRVADRLRDVTRPTDLVARVSGDEFVIVLDNVTTPDIARAVAQRVVDCFESPFRLGNRQVYASTSVGLAFAGPGSCDPAQVLADADVAMYAAKDAGRNRVAEFDETMRARVTARHEIDTALRAAVEREQLLLHYQPVVRIADRSLAGVEGLLRWRRPEVGLLPPDQFVPVAEDNGLIVPIGTWVIEEACRQLAEWRRHGLRVRTGVNVSAHQLHAGGLAAVVQTALDRSHVAPELLVLEITESILVHDVDAAIAELLLLRDLGVSIALDDFGTRYSSLTYLCRLPVDVVKVDRTFTWQLMTDRQSRAVVRMLTGIAQDAGWFVVAEGIESEAQLAAVAELGCDLAQGFLLGAPVEADELPTVVAGWPLNGAAGTSLRVS